MSSEVSNIEENSSDINYEKNNDVIPDQNDQNDQFGPEDNFETAESHESKDETRFKDGQILRFVKVRFPGNAKAFPFFIGKRQFQYGLKVVAMSDRGMMVGYINSFPYDRNYNASLLPVRSIARVASSEDLKQQDDFIAKEKEAEVMCLDLVEKYKLDMVLTHVEYTQFGKKAVFFFTAPARVDFRDLVRELVGKLKMRIELRQISVRDRAAAIGGIGACGLQTCCSSFLSAYGNVSIKMAKNQNLALVPSKLNGVCGQIKCCIKYEDEVYSDKRTRLPRENSMIQLKNGDFGKVVQLLIIEEQFELLSNKGIIKRYISAMNDPTHTPDASCTYPESFEHVSNETKVPVTFENCGPLLEKFRPPKEIVPPKVDEENDDDAEALDLLDDDLDDEIENSENDEDEDEDEDESSNKAAETKKDHAHAGAKTHVAPLQAQKNTAPPASQVQSTPESQTFLGQNKNPKAKENFHKFKKKNKRK